LYPSQKRLVLSTSYGLFIAGSEEGSTNYHTEDASANGSRNRRVALVSAGLTLLSKLDIERGVYSDVFGDLGLKPRAHAVNNVCTFIANLFHRLVQDLACGLPSLLSYNFKAIDDIV